MKKALYIGNSPIPLEFIKAYRGEPENITNSVVVVDIDEVGFSSIPDLKENENVIIALTDLDLPGYLMKLISLGFYDVIHKPVHPKDLEYAIERAWQELHRKEKFIPLKPLKNHLQEELCKELCSIIGNPKGKMKEVLKKLGIVATTEASILITGETGVGKEVFAKAVWKLSNRRNGPFIAINCSAIPSELLEAELFGYEKGAFTGAYTSKEGLIESANGGVLFLDEIGDLPLHIQPKLLRVLQEKRVRRLGGKREIPCNFRLLSATNKDVHRLIREGKFREDLYYRIAAVHVHIPPLRERKDEIPLILECLIKNISEEMDKKIKGYTKEFMEKALSYAWPGNIREMENVLRNIIAFNTTGVLKSEDFYLVSKKTENSESLEDIEDTIRNLVRELINMGEYNVYHKLLKRLSESIAKEAYLSLNRNLSKTAKVLGLNRMTLRKLINNAVSSSHTQ